MNNHMLAIFQLLVLGGIVFFVVLMAQAQPVSSGTGHWSCSDKTLPSGHNSGNAAPDAGLGGSAPAFLRGIGLSNDQQAAISGIIDAQAPKLRAREQGIRTAQQSLQALVASGQYNAAQAQSLARSMSADLAAMMLMDAESDHRIYQLLTNDQRRQIEQMKASGKYRPVCSADGKPRTLVRII